MTGQSGVPVMTDHDALPPAPSRPVALAVPNVSEGRDRATIEALVEAVRLPGVRVLDVHSDADHNRSVVTVAGDPLALQDAMVALAWEAMERIDLRRHRGVHPRIGALDLVPIVALTPDELPMACELATGIAQRIGAELALPVFRYGAIASDPGRTRPHDFRRGGLDALAAAVEDGEITPDDGPHRIHATAGAVMVGARESLIAWNVWMPDATLDQARHRRARTRIGRRPAGHPGAGALPGRTGCCPSVHEPGRLQAHPARGGSRRCTEGGGAALASKRATANWSGLIPAMALLRGPSPSALRLMRFHPGQVLEAQLSTLRRQPPRRD